MTKTWRSENSKISRTAIPAPIQGWKKWENGYFGTFERDDGAFTKTNDLKLIQSTLPTTLSAHYRVPIMLTWEKNPHSAVHLTVFLIIDRVHGAVNCNA